MLHRNTKPRSSTGMGGRGVGSSCPVRPMPWQVCSHYRQARAVRSSYLPPPMSIPPQGTTVPPHPGGNRHQVTVPPLGGGGPYTTPDQPILV